MVDEEFGHWLAGFIDGEGSFCITKRHNRKSYGCSMAIELRKDDTDILYECQTKTGIGEIRFKEARPTQSRNTNASVVWAVRNKEDASKLVKILTTYPLRSKKQRDFLIWSKVVALRTKVKRTNGNPPNVNASVFKEIAALKKTMEDQRCYKEMV